MKSIESVKEPHRQVIYLTDYGSESYRKEMLRTANNTKLNLGNDDFENLLLKYERYEEIERFLVS